MAAQTYSLITIPNDNKPSERVFEKLCNALSSNAEAAWLEMPTLLVGTLDSLMALSDEIEKVDGAVEGLLRKIERQYFEALTASGTGGGEQALQVGSVGVDRYLRSFKWDYAKYPHRRPLSELVQLIQQNVANVEEEVKQLMLCHSEKLQQQQSLKRKKGASAASAALEDVLTPAMVRGVEFHDTEHLVTLLAMVPKAQEETWVANYAALGGDLVGYGGPDWVRNAGALGQDLGGTFGESNASSRKNTMGSPAVPGSSRKLCELPEGDLCVYTVTLLKGQYQAGFVDGDAFQPGTFVDFVEAYKVAARAMKVTLRDYAYDPAQAGLAAQSLVRLDAEVQQSQASLIRWCRTQYGEVFIAWMHTKVIHAFIESVLRYGLPVDFTAALLAPRKNRERQMQQALDAMLGHLPGSGIAAAAPDEEEDGEKYSNYWHDHLALSSGNKD